MKSNDTPFQRILRSRQGALVLAVLALLTYFVDIDALGHLQVILAGVATYAVLVFLGFQIARDSPRSLVMGVSLSAGFLGGVVTALLGGFDWTIGGSIGLAAALLIHASDAAHARIRRQRNTRGADESR